MDVNRMARSTCSAPFRLTACQVLTVQVEGIVHLAYGKLILLCGIG